jgi:preprotein translocase subunit SecF
MELIPPGSNFDFADKRRGFLIASAIINLASTILLFTWSLNYGLDLYWWRGTLIDVKSQD